MNSRIAYGIRHTHQSLAWRNLLDKTNCPWKKSINQNKQLYVVIHTDVHDSRSSQDRIRSDICFRVFRYSF